MADYSEAQAAAEAGTAAAQARMGHYMANVAGQGAGAGDPRPAESTQQPDIGAQGSVT